MVCRIECGSFLVVRERRGRRHEAIRGDVAAAGARRACGDHAQGVPSFAEGAQRLDPAQLRRGRVQRAPGARGGHSRDLAHQRTQGGPGQEALRGGGAGGGPRRTTRTPAIVCPQGGRRVRGAPGGLELCRAAGGPRAVVAAAVGRPGGGARPHRQRVARDRAPCSKKTRSSRGSGSGG